MIKTAIKKDSEVMLRKNLRSGDLVVPKGSILNVVGADYDDDFEIYKLKGSIRSKNKSVEIEIWVYRDSFEPLPY